MDKKEYDKQRYLKNKSYFKEITTRWRNSNREWFIYNAAKNRALKKNLEFTITKEDIVIPEYCPILKKKLIYAGSSHSNKDYSPSLDRIDPSKGYTPENIWVISNKANTMKSNASIEELKTFANWVNSL